jgi:peptidoglycan/xylan/chitin deacetylase (PgdA/CDA1 family)
MVYHWEVPTLQTALADRRRSVLVRQSHLGEFDDPAPRPPLPTDPVLRWARWAFLPASSVMRVATDDPVISLTYDDGPEPDQTGGVLDVLAERNVRATFFVLSDRAEEHPEVVRRMLAEGHEVGLHGIDHTDLTTVPDREAVRRIRVSRQRLEAITGRPVRLYRPTYGALALGPLLAVRALGLEVVIWTVWARDWFDAPAAEVAQRAVAGLHPGAVVLLHDTTDDAQALEAGPAPTFSRAEVTRLVLDGMRAGGYSSVPTGELLRRYPAVRSLTARRPRLPWSAPPAE